MAITDDMEYVVDIVSSNQNNTDEVTMSMNIAVCDLKRLNTHLRVIVIKDRRLFKTQVLGSYLHCKGPRPTQ